MSTWPRESKSLSEEYCHLGTVGKKMVLKVESAKNGAGDRAYRIARLETSTAHPLVQPPAGFFFGLEAPRFAVFPHAPLSTPKVKDASWTRKRWIQSDAHDPG